MPRPNRSHSPATSMLSLFGAAETLTPPSREVVAAVLQFGDVREERADGLLCIRLSARRLAADDLAFLSPGERGRAADVSCLWDEAESELVEVLDLAPARQAAQAIDQVNRYAAARQRSAGLRHGWSRAAAA